MNRGSLTGCTSCGRKLSDTTKQLSLLTKQGSSLATAIYTYDLAKGYSLLPRSFQRNGTLLNTARSLKVSPKAHMLQIRIRMFLPLFMATSDISLLQRWPC